MVELAYERHGAGERIALLHGANQTARSWQRATEALAPTYEVLALDLAFHGHSVDIDVPDVATLGALVGDTVGAATYIGYFVGGRAAIELAFARPHLVKRLVLIGSVAGVASEEERRRRAAEELATISVLEGPEPTASERFLQDVERRLRRDDFFFDEEGEALERAANLENTPRGLAKMHRHLGMGAPGYHERLRELQMPVLVVAGELAPPFVALAEEVVALVGPNATLAVMPGAGHPAPFEQPAAFADLVGTWMTAHPVAGDASA